MRSRKRELAIKTKEWKDGRDRGALIVERIIGLLSRAYSLGNEHDVASH